MHQQLQAFLDEHQAPRHAATRDVHDLARPILEVGIRAKQQVLVYQLLLHEAKYSEHPTELDGKMDRLHQKLETIESAAAAFVRAGEMLADVFTEWDEIMTEDARILKEREGRIGPPSSGGVPATEAIG